VKHPNFDLMHYIYFSRFVFDEFITKGGRECAQSYRTLLLTGWLREVCGKHDKFYQRGRACIEKVRGSVVFFFAFSFVDFRFLATSWFLRFSYSR
jgi:hypothetical protein